MKKYASLCIILLICSAGLFAKNGAKMYVNVQKSDVRTGTGIFATAVGVLFYGDQVTIVSEKDKWVEIVSNNEVPLRGWVPLSSLTKKKIIARNGKNSVSASTEELALAGKGFSADVEDVFRGTADTFRFDLVDIVETDCIDSALLYAFIVEGHLAGGAE